MLPLFVAFTENERKGKEGVGVQKSFKTSKISLGSDNIWHVCRLMGMAGCRGKNSKWKREDCGVQFLVIRQWGPVHRQRRGLGWIQGQLYHLGAGMKAF